jgi:hypothetical protein
LGLAQVSPGQPEGIRTSDRLPGLLEWRNVGGTWRGRVVHPVQEGEEGVVVEEWVDAALLDPA